MHSTGYDANTHLTVPLSVPIFYLTRTTIYMEEVEKVHITITTIENNRGFPR